MEGRGPANGKPRRLDVVLASQNEERLRAAVEARLNVFVSGGAGLFILVMYHPYFVVYDTFLRFFNGVTSGLEWRDTASQITGLTDN